MFIIIWRGVLQWCVQGLSWEGREVEMVDSGDGKNSELGWGPSATRPGAPGGPCKLVIAKETSSGAIIGSRTVRQKKYS